MKIEIEVLESQIDFLRRIKELPALIGSHIGAVPQSWPGHLAEFERIKEICESLEHKWKQWVFQAICNNVLLENFFKDTVLAKKSEYLNDVDLI